MEHRLELVCEIVGVVCINDSKATNVDSAWYALESMTRPTVWIAGGTDKGNDYTPLYDFAKKSVHTLICMGLDNEKLEKSFAGIVPNIISCHSFEEVVKYKDAYDYLFLSPIFDSISKQGYRSKFSHNELLNASNLGIIDSKVIALGGVTPDKMDYLKSLHFGGIAMMGAVWK